MYLYFSQLYKGTYILFSVAVTVFMSLIYLTVEEKKNTSLSQSLQVNPVQMKFL